MSEMLYRNRPVEGTSDKNVRYWVTVYAASREPRRRRDAALVAIRRRRDWLRHQSILNAHKMRLGFHVRRRKLSMRTTLYD